MIGEPQQARGDPIIVAGSDQPWSGPARRRMEPPHLPARTDPDRWHLRSERLPETHGTRRVRGEFGKEWHPTDIAPMLAAIGAGVEFVGGLAIVFGLMTRYAAVLMIVFVIVATLDSGHCRAP